MKLHLLACSALLAASPLVSTFAAEPSLGGNINRESTEIKEGAANNTHGSGYAVVTPMPDSTRVTPTASAPMVATSVGGNVPGDNSTVSGDRAATSLDKTSTVGTGGNR